MSPDRKSNNLQGTFGGSNDHLNANGGPNGGSNENNILHQQKYMPKLFQNVNSLYKTINL